MNDSRYAAVHRWAADISHEGLLTAAQIFREATNGLQVNHMRAGFTVADMQRGCRWNAGRQHEGWINSCRWTVSLAAALVQQVGLA